MTKPTPRAGRGFAPRPQYEQDQSKYPGAPRPDVSGTMHEAF